MTTSPYSFLSILTYLQYIAILPLCGFETKGDLEGMLRRCLGGMDWVSGFIQIQGYTSMLYQPGL